MIKAVLFDLGGTLIKTLEPAKIIQHILQAQGLEAPLNAIAKAHKKTEEEFNACPMHKIGPDFWVYWNAKILHRLGIRKNAEEFAKKIDEQWWDYAGLEAYADVEEALALLRKRNLKLGVVTNGFERDYKTIFAKLGLNEYFDVAVGVDTCGKAKPEEDIFLYAIGKLGVRPENSLFIGDSIEHDYEGARKAGLKALLVDREAKNKTNADVITTLTDVLKYA